MPSGKYLIAIAKTLECPTGWLLLGEGDPDAKEPQDILAGPVDTDVLRQIIEAIEEGLTARNLVAAPDKKAEFIVLLYEYFTETGKEVTKEAVSILSPGEAASPSSALYCQQNIGIILSS